MKKFLSLLLCAVILAAAAPAAAGARSGKFAQYGRIALGAVTDVTLNTEGRPVAAKYSAAKYGFLVNGKKVGDAAAHDFANGITGCSLSFEGWYEMDSGTGYSGAKGGMRDEYDYMFISVYTAEDGKMHVLNEYSDSGEYSVLAGGDVGLNRFYKIDDPTCENAAKSGKGYVNGVCLKARFSEGCTKEDLYRQIAWSDYTGYEGLSGTTPQVYENADGTVLFFCPIRYNTTVDTSGSGDTPADPDPDPKPGYVPGDVTGDGAVNALDYAMLKRSVLGTYELAEDRLAAADVNGDGAIDALDYAMVKRHVLGTYVIGGA